MRIFVDLLPPGEGKRVRKELKSIMDPAGEVRELDIALELAELSGIGPSSPLVEILAAQRAEGERRLQDAIRVAWRRDASLRWRERLHLNP